MSDKIKFGVSLKDEITATDMTVKYRQNPDCCSESNDDNAISIQTEDGGGGVYFVIKTDRFAFSSIEEVVELFEDFKSRVGEEVAE